MILTFRDGKQVEHRSFALTDMVRWGYSGLRSTPGAGTTLANAQAVPAINRAARMRSEAIASLHLKCWRGEGPTRSAAESVPQARFFAKPMYNEYQTRFDFWEAVEESLAYRGNAFVWKLKDPASGQLVEWYALHPDQVVPIAPGAYRVYAGGDYVDPVGHGKAKYEVDSGTIIHFRGHGDGGALLAPSPIQVFRESLQTPLLRIRHENRMWKRGNAGQVGITFPPNVNADQAELFRGQFAANYQGTDGDTTLVVGGGAQLSKIGMTPADALFVEMAHLTREDASMIMGIPANLLGAQLQRAVPNLEQDLATWLRFGLGPELSRIETTLEADPDVFPPGAQTYPRFDTEDFVRGDLITEANIMHQRIQDGTLTPDEARAQLGLPPHPEGVGAIPQITPVGGAANGGFVPPIPAAFSPTPSD